MVESENNRYCYIILSPSASIVFGKFWAYDSYRDNGTTIIVGPEWFTFRDNGKVYFYNEFNVPYTINNRKNHVRWFGRK